MISRRTILKAIVGGITVYPFKNVLALQKTGKVLDMYNIHTGESMDIKYYDSGIYDRKALDEINYFLRCHYTDEVKDIDIGVLDFLYHIKKSVGKDKQVQIISGYRSEKYNRHLRSLGSGVSRNSLHLHGLAIDFRIPGISNDKLSKIAKAFQSGGVGKYPEFVHIDTGPVRNW
jgi:uncharacterized protein YcbK (DUF882 family)